MKTADMIETVKRRPKHNKGTKLQVGDVVEVHGGRSIIWMVNGSRASAFPMSGRRRVFKEGEEVSDSSNMTFEGSNRAIDISPNSEVEILEHLGKQGLIDFLENRNQNKHMSKNKSTKSKTGAKSAKEDKEPSLGRLGGFLGHPITGVIRAMAKAGWEYWECRLAFDNEGIKVADNTIRIQLSAGRAGDAPPAPVEKSALAKIRPDASEKPARKNAEEKPAKKKSAASDEKAPSKKSKKSRHADMDEDEDDEPAPSKSKSKSRDDDEDAGDEPEAEEDGE